MVGYTAPGIYIGSMTHISCNNITIVGKGKGNTTMIGGFYVCGKQNVKIEQLDVRNTSGIGLYCKGSSTNVDVTECCFKKCHWTGLVMYKGAIVAATRCDFLENAQCGVACDAHIKIRLKDCTMHHNGSDGLWADDHAVVDLLGTKTDIHSNKQRGIKAYGCAKVNIYLPSQHNTTHDNVGEDRFQHEGGSIANINADGTFTHVEEEGEVEVDLWF